MTYSEIFCFPRGAEHRFQPELWVLNYQGLSFHCSPSHTGGRGIEHHQIHIALSDGFKTTPDSGYILLGKRLLKMHSEVDV